MGRRHFYLSNTKSVFTIFQHLISFKNLFRLTALLLIFNACNDDQEDINLDDFSIDNVRSTITTVSPEDIPYIMDYARSALGKDLKVTVQPNSETQGSNRNQEPDLILGEVQLGEIKVATNSYDRSNYVFKLKTVNSTNKNSIFNYIVKETSLGLYGLIVEYRFDPLWLKSSTSEGGIDFRTFTGEVIIYDEQGVYIGKNIKENNITIDSDYRTSSGCSCDTGGGGNNGDGSDGTGPGPGTSDGSNNGDSGTGGDQIDVEVTCGCDPDHPGGNQNDDCHCEKPDTITITIRSVETQESKPFTNRCCGTTESCAGETDCEFGYDEFCGCKPEPDDEEEVENSDIPPSIDITSIAIVAGIDDTNLNDCHKNIFNDLKGLEQNDLKLIIDHFEPESPYSLEMKTETLAPLVFGSTNWQSADNGSALPYNYIIKVSDLPASATDLHLAQTMLHELIHALFLSYADDLLQTGEDTLEDFPMLWDWYVENIRGGNANSVHHEVLADLYVDALARALQEYDTGNPVPNDETPEEVYSDLAWGGLTGTDIFDQMHPPMSDSRERIEDRIFAEAFNVTSGEQMPQGTPCN